MSEEPELRVTISFKNLRTEIQEVYVEPNPDRFRLRPKEVLSLTFGTRDSANPVNIQVHDQGLITLWPFNWTEIDYEIDGVNANERSWAD